MYSWAVKKCFWGLFSIAVVVCCFVILGSADRLSEENCFWSPVCGSSLLLSSFFPAPPPKFIPYVLGKSQASSSFSLPYFFVYQFSRKHLETLWRHHNIWRCYCSIHWAHKRRGIQLLSRTQMPASKASETCHQAALRPHLNVCALLVLNAECYPALFFIRV